MITILEPDEDSEFVDGNAVPLITTPSLGEKIKKKNGEVFMASNPSYTPGAKPSTNSAVESEYEETTATETGDKNSNTTKSSDQLNQTYV